MNQNQINDRRQRATDTGYDELSGPEIQSRNTRDALEAAAETATRVQITPEALDALERQLIAVGNRGPIRVKSRAALTAALQELGFEVEA